MFRPWVHSMTFALIGDVMNAIDQSSNRLPIHTDWQRYDSPTVLRRHGLGFLERLEQLRGTGVWWLYIRPYVLRIFL